MSGDHNNFGLDKRSRTISEQEAALAREIQDPPRLEPDFPWTASPAFDPGFMPLPEVEI